MSIVDDFKRVFGIEPTPGQRMQLGLAEIDEQRENRAKQLHLRIIEEFYKPAVEQLELEYKEHIEENKRLKDEIKLLQAKLDGFELAKQMFIDGYKSAKETR